MTMPGGNRQANVTVTADTSAFVKGINSANQAAIGFANTLKKIDDSVLKIAKVAGAGAMAVGGAGLLSAFGDVKSAAALEQSFKSLSAQATLTGQSVTDIHQGIVKMGADVPVSTQALAAMATQISALGITGTKNLLTLTKQAEQLAAATNTAPGQLMTGLVQLNQSLGGSVENLSRYGSALTALQAKTGVASTDVLNFVSGIEAVGAKAGVTEQQMIGLSAAFVKVGADGFAGAQAFNQVVNDMTDAVSRNSPKVQQYASLLGMTSDQFKKLISSGDSMQAFIGFIDAVSNSGAKATQVLSQFGLDSVRTQRVFAALTSGQANLAQMMSQTNTAFDQNTATATASQAAWSGLDDQFIKIANAGTRMKDELGAPLLSIFTPLAQAIGVVENAAAGMMHVFNDAPWPIGGTITSLVTKTPALLLLGGAFLTVTASITKFAGAWRMMSSGIGGGLLKGVLDGRRGTPSELSASTGTMGGALYRRAYGMSTGSDRIGVNATRGVGSMIAGYPMMRARQQLGGALDTMMHPLDASKRNSGRRVLGMEMRTDPFSAQGMWEQGRASAKTWQGRMVSHLRAQDQVDENGNPTQAAALAGRIERIGTVQGDSPEALRRRRFDYVEKARAAGTARQAAINSSVTPDQLRQQLAASEYEQYVAKNGSEEGFSPTPWKSIGDRTLYSKGYAGRLANYAGNQTADKAGKAFDASLSEEATAKLANPFQKLAAKVKTITAELTNSTGEATNAVMGKISTFFGAAMDKIVALAAKAKGLIVEVQAYAENPAASALTSLPANAVSGGSVSAAEEAVGRAATQPMPRVFSVGGAGSGATEVTERTAEQTTLAVQQAKQAAEEEAKRALPNVDELARKTAYGIPAEEAAGPYSVIQMSRRPGVPQRPANPEEGTGPGWQRGGEEGDSRGWAGSWRSGRAWTSTKSAVSRAASATGEVAASGAKALGSAFGSLKTVLMGVMSPQVMIAATLFGPALYQMVSSLIDSHRKLSDDMAYAGAAVQQALGRQVTTQADLVKQQQQKNNSQGASNPWGTDEQNNAKAGTFDKNYKDQIDELHALGSNQANPSKSQISSEQSWAQNYVNGLVVQQGGGKPADDQDKQQVRELLLNATGGNDALAKQIYNQIDWTGAKSSDYFSQVGAAYGRTGSSDLRASLSTTALGNFNTNTGGGIAGLIAAAAASSQANGGNVYQAGMANNQMTGSAKSGETRNAYGVGDGRTADLLKQFLNDYNKANPDAQVNLKAGEYTLANAGDPNSVQDLYKQLQVSSKAGDKGSQNILDQLNSVLSGKDFNSDGTLKQASIARITQMASAGTTTSASNSPSIASQLDGTALNNAYRKSSGDKNGYVTSLLGNPDDANYDKNVGKMMSQLTGDATAFSGNAVPAFQAAAKAIQAVKDTLSPTSVEWQQLDKIAQTNFSNLAQAATIGGGQTFQLGAQTQMVGTMVDGGITGTNYDDIKAQNDSLTQMSQQAVQTLDQYYVQVRDAHIQTQREQEDHNTQMSRMQRDYNKQVDEANYQNQKQIDEANYNYKLQQTQQLYQFNEQIRSMKYSVANAYGNPGSIVQAQYTQGVGSQLLGIQQQTKNLQASKDAIDKMQSMGVSTDAIRIFQLDDPKNFQQAQKDLLDFVNDPKLIQSFNATVASQLNIANAIASDPNNSQYADMKRQFDYTAGQAATAFTHAADVSSTAFAHSMDLNKKQMEQSTADFTADYEKSQTRASEDLARLGEDTTKSWQDLVSWAQKSGLPWVKALGDQAETAIGQVDTAAAKLNATIAGLPKALTDNLPALQAALGQVGNILGGAFGGIRGIFGGISTGGGGDSGSAGLNGVSINYSGGAAGVRQGAVVGAAESWLGTPYDWGGEGLDGQGVDCSGLVIAAYRAAGIPFAGRPVASTLGKMGKAVSQAQALPGDVVYYDEPGPIDHVGIYLGSGKMIDSPTQGEKVRVDNIGTPTSIRRMYAQGAVFDSRSDITVGEAGPEIVLPLNAHGAQFMAQTMRASLQKMGADPNLANEVRRGRVAQGMPMQAASNMSYHHTDASTNFHGAITVVASDPNDMARQLAAKKRQQALTRPMARR